jgi:hypothetical protein
MDLDHKHYFIIFIIVLLVWILCAKVIYKRICNEII